MELSNEPTFDAPIPGQSLTGEVGSKPWEQPPKLNTVDEVISSYIPMFQDEEFVTELVNQMEAGIPIIPIVDILIKSNVMDGEHSLDVGLLAAPVIIELLINVAEASDIEYDVGNKTKGTTKPSMSAIALALKDINIPDEEDTEDTMVTEVEEPPMEQSMGLMAKRGEEYGV
jgi:hypothetical protein|tara:strand:+ start:98 stop:613 length:516 start_codon:yes stop_codon:yes gene_type:complete